MKKTIRMALAVVILTALSFLLYRIATTVKAKQNTHERIRVLNNLFPLLPKGFVYTGKAVGINYFDPGCSHCQYMAEEIVKNKQHFSHSLMVMITEASKKDTDSFARQYALSGLAFLSITRDSLGLFYKTFGTRITPSFFIYNKEHQLVKIIKGETKIENILNALNENATQ